MTYVVYADVLLILNFACDFLLLYASGGWLQLQRKLSRLSAAAALGALYAAGQLLPQLHLLYTLPAAVLASLLMLAVAYPRQRGAAFLHLVGCFYAASFALGGAALGLSTFMVQRGIAMGLPQMQLAALLFAVPVLFILLRPLARQAVQRLRGRFDRGSYRLALEVQVMGQSARLPALLDTGNDLHEPFSALPVVVAEYAALEALLPLVLRQAWRESGGDAAAVLQAAVGLPGWQQRLRLVPFASIGREHGLLLGFRADALYLIGEAGRQAAAPAVICLYPKPLHTDYAAVINPEILQCVEGRNCA